MREIKTPINKETIKELRVGDTIMISGNIFCGRDAVLPKLAAMDIRDIRQDLGVDLEGGVVFHTAVSPAGVGPTSSNKADIEGSIPELSKKGIRIHLGKGALRPETVEALKENDSIFAITPPVTALFKSSTVSVEGAAFAEEGMEALHRLEVTGIPAIVAIANGESLW